MEFGLYAENESHLDDYGKNCANGNLISEAGLSRLLSQSKNNDFVIITAYRSEYDKKTNIARNRKLRGFFNSKKMGVYQLVGHWRECSDSTIDYDKCPPSKLVDVIERSYMVIRPENMDVSDFLDTVIELTREFDQDGALVKIGNEYKIFGKDGKSFVIGKFMTLGKISQAYSQFVKKMNTPFVFEGVEIPASISGRMMFTLYGVHYPSLSLDEYKKSQRWEDL